VNAPFRLDLKAVAASIALPGERASGAGVPSASDRPATATRRSDVPHTWKRQPILEAAASASISRFTGQNGRTNIERL
jgi:hypothetical protein